MRKNNTYLWAAIGLIIYAVLYTMELNASEPNSEALWLARSCIGEAGWKAHETGECAAIMHIYRKRGILNGKGTLWTAKKYSAAIKPGVHQRNKWVMNLNVSGKPERWPLTLDWDRYEMHWLRTYFQAQLFINNMLRDPTPDAMHYGSSIDHHRAKPNWKRLNKPNFRNWFYKVR